MSTVLNSRLKIANLKPDNCPKCDSKVLQIHIEIGDRVTDSIARVSCISCGLFGPYNDPDLRRTETIEDLVLDAVKWWNHTGERKFFK